MTTRREVLLGLMASPLTFALNTPAKQELYSEPHCLSQESARGFELLLQRRTGAQRGIIILPGARDLSPESCSEILRKVNAGASVVYESGLCFSSYNHAVRQCHMLNTHLGVNALPPVRASGYVTYTWPVQKVVRSFQAVTPVRCGPSEMIAYFNGIPVCMKRSFGRGAVIYLGSMLGPGLYAEEREAHIVGDAMLRNYSDS